MHTNDKKVGVAILISDKIDFKTKAIKKDKEHYIMIKGSIQGEDITLVNIYAPYIAALKYVKQITDIKRETDRNTIIVGGDFNTPLRASRQRISKATEIPNDTIEQ